MKTINDAAIECANIYLQGYRDSYPSDENDFGVVIEGWHYNQLPTSTKIRMFFFFQKIT